MLSLGDGSVIRVLHQILHVTAEDLSTAALCLWVFNQNTFFLSCLHPEEQTWALLLALSGLLRRERERNGDWGNSCGGELWHFAPLPCKCCCISIEEGRMRGRQKRHVSRAVSVSAERRAREGGRRSPPVTQHSLSQQISTSPCSTEEVTLRSLLLCTCAFLIAFVYFAWQKLEIVATHELMGHLPKYQLCPCCIFICWWAKPV